MRTRIKFCGFTDAREARAAFDCGVDAIGVIFSAASPRQVSPAAAETIAAAVPAFVSLVAVFVNPTAAEVARARATGFVPQFHGDEPAPDCERIAAGPYIKVFHVPAEGGLLASTEFMRSAEAYARATWMFDTAVAGRPGGTGRAFDWDRVRTIAGSRPVIISGGLTPQNVGECIRRLRPHGVDVRSGIETDGRKDPAKMRAFVRAVKEADAQT